MDEAKENLYSWQDVAKHNTEQSCWVTVRGKVYDITCEWEKGARYQRQNL